ncbi:MAG TPA: MYXO-CTERM sorting domain-containing protein [Sandaracinaceae bacterium LLY-WYZ-13_1]|nr:MYXO-CTERM sorting domain-containing protein [Sandaracinaceae bacterium LLY-WYZ-13_1]
MDRFFASLVSLVALLAAAPAAAQPVLTAGAPSHTEGFEGFDGTGFAPSPAAGQLDSDTWRVLGASDGDGTFGGTHDSGDFSRGSSAGGETTGGVYAFDVSASDTAIGLQSSGSDFTPGSVQLRLENGTGAPLAGIEIDAGPCWFNDQARSTVIRVRVIRISDGAEVGMDVFTTPEAADAAPVSWTCPATVALPINLSSMPIADGGLFIVSFDVDDAAGSGSRDEVALPGLTVTAVPDTCGDGTVDGGEACDDGNRVTETECPYGTASCMACSDDCSTSLSLTGAFCGDGTTDTGEGEVCDDGNDATETECPYGTASCTACAAGCGSTLSLTGRVCGDGTNDPEEVCDDGDTITETACDYGMSTCTLCSDDCGTPLSLTGPVCGDGTVDAGEGEACDDGNTVDETECDYGTPTCTGCSDDCVATLDLTGAFCGDGTVDAAEGEACDDGNTDDGDGCSASCALEGDGGVGTDAGTSTPDAGAMDEDAGTMDEDAGTSDEDAASPGLDGGAGTDAGTEPMRDDGCSCRAAGSPRDGSSAPWLALGLGLALAWRRRAARR